jgi:hypothetical protein
MGGKLAVCVLGVAVAAAANPYETISRHNVFHLAPPKPDVSEPGEVFKPPPDIKLNGVAAFGSHKWVLLTRAAPGKPPRHFMMRESEQADGLEIVQIDEVAAIARIRSEGELLELKLATNTLPKIDLATQRFVNEHARAHELHQRREAARIARERAEVERMQQFQRTREIQPHNSSPAEQAILESER